MTASRPSTRTPPAEDDDLRSLLGHAARIVQSGVDGVDGAGVTVLLGGGVVYGCADDFAATIDAVQYRLMQGPCVEATASGAVVRSDAIGRSEQRWPDFTGEAGALALRGVVSVPLRAGGAVIGSLNLYSRRTGGLVDLDDTSARGIGERILPAVRNARLIAVAAGNSLVLRGSSTARRPADRPAGRPTRARAR